MNKEPRILIGTLYSGENELDECKHSLSEQTYTNWTQRIIAHLPNKTAHDTLYREFMSARNDFHLFLKLDADMVFRASSGLSQIVNLFSASFELDHAEIAVKDWFSNQSILGLHAFSNKCRWHINDENLFVDPDPESPTPKRTIWQAPAPLVNHCPNPSPFQSFHFGVHRALKVAQSGRGRFDWFQFDAQSDLLQKVWNNFVDQKDIRIGFAVLGADLVFSDVIKPNQYDYTNPQLLGIFNKYKNLRSGDVSDLLGDKWNKEFHRKKIKKMKMGKNPLSFFSYKLKTIRYRTDL